MTYQIVKFAGTELNYHQIIYNKQYCSKKCLQNDPEFKQKLLEKRTKTCLKKFGVPYAVSNYKNRKKLTLKQKKLALKKREQTCLKKFGAKSNFQTIEFKEKSKQTCLKKYGVENPAQSEEIKLKIKNTNNNKSQKEKNNILNKSKQTNIKKYGVDHFTKNPSKTYILKQKERARQKTWNTILSYKDFVIPLFNKNDLATMREKKIYKWKCTLCRKLV